MPDSNDLLVLQNISAGPASSNNGSRRAWLRALEGAAAISRGPHSTFAALLNHLAEKFATAPALISDQESLTYRALAERTNQYTRWALQKNLATGDVVCLLLLNCPDYLAIWAGISRTGATVALINTNLTGAPLAHSVNLVTPKHVIVGAELAGNLTAILSHVAPGVRCWVHGSGNDDLPRIDDEIGGFLGDRIEPPSPNLSDRALYIYTSGTTGLPKAANVSHFRVLQWSHWFAGMMDTRPNDRMYNCLPMYHSVGGIVASTATLVNGGSVVLRQRFSASQFWDDIVTWDCTLFQYIGELCRYLVNGAPDPRETHHRIRLCCGIGLRGDIWEALKRRFHIPQILEFYAATEGTFSLYNYDEKPGAVGRVPAFLAHRFHVALIKVDTETGSPLRAADGLCIRCANNEIGEALGKIGDDLVPGARFEGYADRDASEKKVLRNVFAAGDAWFRTGDLMRRDARGYFYFIDRTGDTFRWKGENVATTEVEEIMLAFPAALNAVVYGVSVPGTEGRAGMASIVVRPGFTLDLPALRQYLETSLPAYARPLFLRIRNNLELTETFKVKKQDLVRDAFDPTATSDAIYFYELGSQTFIRVDAALYEKIVSRKVRL